MTAQRIVPPDTAFRLSHSKRKRPRIEDGHHLKWIRLLPCLITGRRDGIEAAHVRYADPVYGKRDLGKSEKPDDRWAVPLHHEQHRDQHTHGNERDWWASIGIDPLQVALALYNVTGDDEAAEVILTEARGRKK